MRGISFYGVFLILCLITNHLRTRQKLVAVLLKSITSYDVLCEDS